ncbi:MAG: hypothetical protein C0482_25125 [Gordonia sp.]|jgi:hypothetical protein|uniref:Cupin n=1 Tax=Gordonia rubripertincta TaxID=36822 RepID=A0ABT4MQY0_GORRU|nr:hypothetical protein [Gordonia rubripertincta]MBA4025648.1 hypothetical protein [Gordonia sp. (in: high G+C Gram-positive bacteria)]MCZ4549411.1 hypothetical protein [Gordonia rubripertincta]
MTDTPAHSGEVIPPTPGDTLVFENDRVRVWSMTLEPGGMFDFHQHHHDHVVIWPDAGDVQGQELGDAEWGIAQHADPGFVLYKTVGSSKPLHPHRIRNLGDEKVTHFIIELLETSPSAVELPWQHNDRGSFTTPDGR